MKAKVQNALNEQLGTAQRMRQEQFQPIQRLMSLELEGHTYKFDSAVYRHCTVASRIKGGWEVMLQWSSLSF